MHVMSVLQETLGAALTSRGERNHLSRPDAQALLGLNRSLVVAFAQRDEVEAASLAEQHAEVRRSIIARAVPAERPQSASSQAAE